MVYPDLFSKTLDITLEFEGGYVDNPKDPGGETCFGLTRKNHPDLMLWDWLDAKKPLSKSAKYWRINAQPAYIVNEVRKTYYVKYYQRNSLDKFVSQNFAMLFFDFTVHSGANAVKECCKLLNISSKIKVDDEFINLVNEACKNEKIFCLSYLAKREAFLENFISRKPERNVFKAGFENRLKKLRSILVFVG